MIVKNTVEVVYTWPDGREEVRYRRPYPSDSATDFMDEVDKLRRRDGEECPYSYRFVSPKVDGSE